jgi:hypothetical protein
VKELARQGKIPGIKVGRLWRFSEEALLEWVGDKSKSHPGDVESIVDRIIGEAY